MAIDYIKRLRAELAALTTVAASEAKNQFGQVLDTALRDGPVVITKHDTPKAILISIEEFEAMTMPRRNLELLSAKWDAMMSRMQTPKARAAIERAFDASPTELGAAAVAAVRKKR